MSKTKRPQEEIDAEINALTEMKDKVSIRAFGYNNRKSIEAQIWVLNLKGNYPDADQIYDRYDDMDIQSEALNAYDWMMGDDSEGTPSSQWATLVEDEE